MRNQLAKQMCLECLSPSFAKPNMKGYIGVRDNSLITGYYVYNKNNEYLPQVGTMNKRRNNCSVEVLQLNDFVPNLKKKKSGTFWISKLRIRQYALVLLCVREKHVLCFFSLLEIFSLSTHFAPLLTELREAEGIL